MPFDSTDGVHTQAYQVKPILNLRTLVACESAYFAYNHPNGPHGLGHSVDGSTPPTGRRTVRVFEKARRHAVADARKL